MKKMLFLAAALLITMGAAAQLKQSSLAQMPVAQMKEMKMGTPGMPVSTLIGMLSPTIFALLARFMLLLVTTQTLPLIII